MDYQAGAETLSAQMQDACVAFARTGSPQTSDLPDVDFPCDGRLRLARRSVDCRVSPLDPRSVAGGRRLHPPELRQSGGAKLARLCRPLPTTTTASRTLWTRPRVSSLTLQRAPHRPTSVR